MYTAILEDENNVPQFRTYACDKEIFAKNLQDELNQGNYNSYLLILYGSIMDKKDSSRKEILLFLYKDKTGIKKAITVPYKKTVDKIIFEKEDVQDDFSGMFDLNF
jgi:hypothetical protein